MLDYGDVEYFRPLARGVHFIASASVGLLACYATSRSTSWEFRTKHRSCYLAASACLLIGASLVTHAVLDVCLRVP